MNAISPSSNDVVYCTSDVARVSRLSHLSLITPSSLKYLFLANIVLVFCGIKVASCNGKEEVLIRKRTKFSALHLSLNCDLNFLLEAAKVLLEMQYQ